MENSELLIQVLKLIVWPFVVVVLAVIFRRDLSKLINRIVQIKGEKWEIKMQEQITQQITQVSNDAKELLPEMNNVSSTKILAEVNLRELVNLSPSAAVFESWKLVEKAAKGVISRKGYEPDYDIDTAYKLIEDSLIKGGMVDKKTGVIFKELRQLRNKLAHASGFTISPDSAIQYVDLAIRLRDKLDSIAT